MKTELELLKHELEDYKLVYESWIKATNKTFNQIEKLKDLYKYQNLHLDMATNEVIYLTNRIKDIEDHYKDSTLPF